MARKGDHLRFKGPAAGATRAERFLGVEVCPQVHVGGVRVRVAAQLLLLEGRHPVSTLQLRVTFPIHIPTFPHSHSHISHSHYCRIFDFPASLCVHDQGCEHLKILSISTWNMCCNCKSRSANQISDRSSNDTSDCKVSLVYTERT